MAVPPAVPAAPARIEVSRKKRSEGGPGRCGRPADETIRRGEPSKRQAVAFQGTSGIHRATRHGDVLPGRLANWHGIGKGQALRPPELKHIAAAIERWMRIQSAGIPEEPAQGRLL